MLPPCVAWSPKTAASDGQAAPVPAATAPVQGHSRMSTVGLSIGSCCVRETVCVALSQKLCTKGTGELLLQDRGAGLSCGHVVPARSRANLRLKAHVQHAVGFIQHHERRPAQRAGLHLDQINHAPRRADRHLQSHSTSDVARPFCRSVHAHAPQDNLVCARTQR